jgi:hypothetical protein
MTFSLDLSARRLVFTAGHAPKALVDGSPERRLSGVAGKRVRFPRRPGMREDNSLPAAVVPGMTRPRVVAAASGLPFVFRCVPSPLTRLPAWLNLRRGIMNPR